MPLRGGKWKKDLGYRARSQESVKAGAVTFGLEYHHSDGDGDGICIHLFADAIPGEDKELLRFDLYDRIPHYHYRNPTVKMGDMVLFERIHLDPSVDPDPIAWALDKIKNRLPSMLIRCQAEDVARSISQREIDAALPKIAAAADMLTRSKAKAKA